MRKEGEVGMTESERIFEALRNCVTIPKCRDCPWAECEEFNNEKVTIPKDLALAVLRELADAHGKAVAQDEQ